jgi:hypothetical protein
MAATRSSSFRLSMRSLWLILTRVIIEEGLKVPYLRKEMNFQIVHQGKCSLTYVMYMPIRDDEVLKQKILRCLPWIF